MKAFGFNTRLNKLFIILIVFTLCNLVPSMCWSSGYQEDKLFDGDFYTQEDLENKIESHTKEIKILNDDIKSLETDIDWLVLKINQIEDSGRRASPKLKEAIKQKEKKIETLTKSRNRLEYLVQFYSSGLKPHKGQSSNNNYKPFKLPSVQRKPDVGVRRIQPKVRKREYDTSSMFSAPVENSTNQPESLSRTELQTAINRAGLNDWVELHGAGTCIKLKTTLPILFPTGSAKVAREYKVFFKKLANFLKPYDVKVLVNGYADKVPIKTKKYPSNFELGATRAANIVHQLVGYGLKPSIFRIESTGKYRFAAKTPSKQKSLERRAEVTVIFSG